MKPSVHAGFLFCAVLGGPLRPTVMRVFLRYLNISPELGTVKCQNLPRPPLAEVQVRTAKPKEKPYKLTDGGGGLHLLVKPDGAKYWRLGYRFGGVELRRLEIDIFPQIGAMPIGSVTHQHMIAALRKIEARGALEIAHRLKATCARVFTYAKQQGIENRNPAADMKDVLRPAQAGHFAAISADELPDFLKAMNANDARLFKPTRIALRLMMLVFVRTSELIETSWSEINLDSNEWIIPWQRMKRGKLTVNPDKTNHHICLSRQALELLKVKFSSFIDSSNR